MNKQTKFFNNRINVLKKNKIQRINIIRNLRNMISKGILNKLYLRLI